VSDVLPWLPWSHRVLEGPLDVGTEQRWRIELDDGRRVLVGQLASDLARDESIRRRYVRDAERVRDLSVYALVPTLALGPAPDPRDPAAIAPWRARLDPPGETLEAWLRRAPFTLEELTAVFVGLADALAAVHAGGVVLRDLRPLQVLHAYDGRVLLVDVGLSRVDVLSSHTASSLLMQGSAYAAPEQVHRTAVDQRSDLFGLGVMMWQALTGALPFGDGPAFLRERDHALPPLARLRGDVPPTLELLVRALLEDDPSRRPGTAGDVAWVLRGGAPTSLVEQATTMCQHCGTRLRVGQRLCLSCGRLSVRFVEAVPGEASHGLDLHSLDEDARKLKWLQGFVRDVSEGVVLPPEFLVGQAMLYAEEERRRRIRLPARLFGNLSLQTAEALQETMQAQGLDARLARPQQVVEAKRQAWIAAAMVSIGCVVLATLGAGVAAGVVGGLGLLATLLLVMRHGNLKNWLRTIPRFRLRRLPAALPASDPLVARLAALLHPGMAGDVRAVIGELALLVQRLVDHRARHVRDHRELDMLTAPVEPLVAAVERLVRQLDEIARELAELDEGAMVRALAASTARRESPAQRESILQGLDRLRALEDRRAEVFHRLLEARSLLTRTVELGLAVHDEGLEHERQLALALAALGG
jgi:hypothetical protein